MLLKDTFNSLSDTYKQRHLSRKDDLGDFIEQVENVIFWNDLPQSNRTAPREPMLHCRIDIVIKLSITTIISFVSKNHNE